MPTRTEAIFDLKDQMSRGLDTIHSSSTRLDRALEHLDTTAERLGRNTAIDKWAATSSTGLKVMNTEIDASIAKIAELKAESAALGRDKVEAEVKVKGVREALAEVMALRAVLSSLGGNRVDLPPEVRSALPPSFRQGFENVMGQRVDRAVLTPLAQLPGGGGTSTGALPATEKLDRSLTTFDRDLRALTPSAGVPFANPSRALVPSAGGAGSSVSGERAFQLGVSAAYGALQGAGGGSGGGGSAFSGGGIPGGASGGGGGGGGLGLGGLALAAAPLLGGGVASTAGGLVSAAGGGIAGLAAGAGALIPAAGAIAIGGGALKLGAKPVTTAIQGVTQALQQNEETRAQQPGQVAAAREQFASQMAQQREQFTQQRALAAEQRAVALSQLTSTGQGPGTFQYIQAQKTQALQERQQKQAEAASVAQARQQQARSEAERRNAAARQESEAINAGLRAAHIQPGTQAASRVLGTAGQVKAFQGQYAQAFVGGARGAQTFGAIDQGLGFLSGPGLKLVTSQWDAFFPVVDKTLTRIEHFVSSKQGSAELALWTNALPLLAEDVTKLAGGAFKLGGTLTSITAPATHAGLSYLTEDFGKLNAYFQTPTGISTMHSTFAAAQPVIKSTAGFVGAIAKGFDEMLTHGGGQAWTQIMQAATRDVPGLVAWMDRGTANLPQLGGALHALGQDMKLLFGETGEFAIALKLLTEFFNLIGGLGPGAVQGAGTAIATAGLLKFAGGKLGGGKALSALDTALVGAPLAAGAGSAALGTAETAVLGAGALGGTNLLSKLGKFASKPSTGILSALVGGVTTATSANPVPGLLGGAAGAGLAGLGIALAPETFGLSTLLTLGGLGATVGSIFSGGKHEGAKPVPVLEPSGVNSQALLQSYFNQRYYVPEATGTPAGGGRGALGPTGYAGVAPTTYYRGAPIIKAGSSGPAAERELAAFQGTERQISQQTLSQGNQLRELVQSYREITHQVNLAKHGSQEQLALQKQQKSALEQIKNANPYAVNTNEYGEATGVNKAHVNVLSGLSAHPSAKQILSLEHQAQGRKGAALGALGGLRARLGALHAPAHLTTEVLSAISSGNYEALGNLTRELQPHGGLAALSGARGIEGAIQQFAPAGFGLSEANAEEEQLAPYLKGLTPAQRAAVPREEAAKRAAAAAAAAAKAKKAHDTAWNNWYIEQWEQKTGHRWPGRHGAYTGAVGAFGPTGSPGQVTGAVGPTGPVGTTGAAGTAGASGVVSPGTAGATTATGPAAAGISGVTSSQNRQAAMGAGKTLAQNIVQGLDSQTAYNEVWTAGRGIGDFAVKGMGSTEPLAGARKAGEGAVQGFAGGVKAAESSAGAMINKAFFNLGFNAAYSAAAGARAGAPSSSGGGSSGGGSAALHGGLFPGHTTFATGRTDAGKDFSNIKGSIGAVAGGTIAGVHHYSGFGTTIFEKLATPIAGKSYAYYALESGGTYKGVTGPVNAGTPIATGTGGVIEVGLASKPNVQGIEQRGGGATTPTGSAFAGAIHAAAGGRIPGLASLGDVVPAMLRPGEEVLTPDHQRSLISLISGSSSRPGHHVKIDIGNLTLGSKKDLPALEDALAHSLDRALGNEAFTPAM